MARRCPVCGKELTSDRRDPNYPFCSRRCKLVDLGNWLSDKYRISEPIPNSEGVNPETETEEEKK